jgi:hypothetical protein
VCGAWGCTEPPYPGVGTCQAHRRERLYQADSWHRGVAAGNDPYADDRCCYCGRPVRAGFWMLNLTRTYDGNWWVAPPGSPVTDDEREFGHFTLPIGDDCFDAHPEFDLGIDHKSIRRRSPSPTKGGAVTYAEKVVNQAVEDYNTGQRLRDMLHNVVRRVLEDAAKAAETLGPHEYHHPAWCSECERAGDAADRVRSLAGREVSDAG